MPRALLLSLVTLAGLHSMPADACTCASTRIEDVTRTMDVVVEAIVGEARAEADGTLSSPLTFKDVLRGPLAGTVARVTWVKPDGVSCQSIDLRPGRWLLFLSWSPDGRLTVVRCDQHSTRLKSDAQWRTTRTKLVASLSPVKSEAEAIEAAGLAVRRMLIASMAGKDGTDLAGPLAGRDLARTDRAHVTAQKDGWVVRWSQVPPAGFHIDAEVRVAADGTAQVVRAAAGYSPD